MRAALLLVALLGLPGCAWVSASGSFGPHLDPQVIAQIEPGTTTKAQILAWLGPPEEFLRSEVVGSLGDDVTRLEGATALGNRARDAFTYQQDHLRGGGTFLLLFNRARLRMDSDLLVIFFDAEDRVREVAFRRIAE